MPRSLTIALLVAVSGGASARAGVLDCGPWRAVISPPFGVEALSHRDDAILRSETPPPFPIVRGGGTGVVVLRDWAADGDGLGFRAALRAIDSSLQSDLELSRRFAAVGDCTRGFTVAEQLSIAAATPIVRGLEVRVPLLRFPLTAGNVFVPRRDGRGVLLETNRDHCVSYELGGDSPFEGCIPLAVPVIDVALGGGRRLAIFTDPMFTASFRLQRDGESWVLWLGWRHPKDVPFSQVDRGIYYHVHGDLAHAALDAFMAEVAVAATPAWTADIGLVYFDYLSDRGEGWARDLDVLAANIPPQQRHRVAVTVHGWYDVVGSYSYDRETDRFRERWFGQEERWGRAVPLDMAAVRDRLDDARDLGFRVLIYFADGLSFDRTTAVGETLDPILGMNSWNGPDVVSELAVASPADAGVRDFFHAYLRALLCEVGDHVDGLVWDETFWPRRGAYAETSPPAHADVAMMTLTRELTAIVSEWNPDIAFLTSEAPGLGALDPPPYVLMAHGTFQDSECDPVAWSYGLFPNWRKPLWSVLWASRTRFADMATGVNKFGAPVSLANGWADDWGPSEMSADELRRALDLARLDERPRRRPRYLEVDPVVYLAAP